MDAESHMKRSAGSRAARRVDGRETRRRVSALVGVIALGLCTTGAARAKSLDEELGRNEVRVYSRPLRIEVGDSVISGALAERLDLRDYSRVRRRPERPGEYFWGYDNFWLYRRASTIGRSRDRALLVQLELERETGAVRSLTTHPVGAEARPIARVEIEPLLLAESLREVRAAREPIELDRIPEHVWRSVLAIEDSRFFGHGGVDPRSVARAMLKNARAGRVTQGGSTITQQLIKMRDLSPRRTLGRKVSEAVRALALEAEYDKREILEAYLDAVYMGHVEGVAVHGIGAAARTFFGKSASALDLGEGALLAAMIQGPNRLDPRRHPERVLARQRLVLERLADLGWVEPAEVERVRRRGLPRLSMNPPAPGVDRRLLAWIESRVEEEAPRRSKGNKGFIVGTTIDPLLQRAAEAAVSDGLARLRRAYPRLRRQPLAAALVSLDAQTGDVLAHVGGDPARREDAFDRARAAKRQPGSAVKPLVLLEALERCGNRTPLTTSRRVIDQPVELPLPSGTWSPENSDRRFRGEVSVRQAMLESLNVPFVRIARHCGFEPTAARLRRAGLTLPPSPPPAFALGAVETTPLEMASAYTVFTMLGERTRARVLLRLRASSGRGMHRGKVVRRRVTSPATAYIVRDLLRQTVEQGTAASAGLGGRETIGKTGTSSERRDAWFVGSAGSVVTAVWVGVDSGQPLGATGAGAAAPIWREFMERSDPGIEALGRPAKVVERWVDDRTGLTVAGPGAGRSRHLFRRGTEPKRKRPWRRTAVPVIR